jgi:hypothetical protein
MIDGLNEYLDFIKANYYRWMLQCRSDVRDEMTKEFSESVTFEVGSKYIKVITGREQRSVHSFICLKDNGKFKKGDILKAAGWSAPARNFARGNVMTKQYGATTWTGAM